MCVAHRPPEVVAAPQDPTLLTLHPPLHYNLRSGSHQQSAEQREAHERMLEETYDPDNPEGYGAYGEHGVFGDLPEHNHGSHLDYPENEPSDIEATPPPGEEDASEPGLFQTPPSSSQTRWLVAEMLSRTPPPVDIIDINSQHIAPIDPRQPIVISGTQFDPSIIPPVQVDSSPPTLPGIHSLIAPGGGTQEPSGTQTGGSSSGKRRLRDEEEQASPSKQPRGNSCSRKTRRESRSKGATKEEGATNGSDTKPGDSSDGQPRTRALFKCAVCLDKPDPAVFVQPCGHVFCEGCAQGAVQSTKRCPVCRHSMRAKDIRVLQFRVARVGR
ncbi:hypothetical protein GQ54DRAFT_297318 [Martensiomyces pterosporus]|nr:hypothetical protein GQ54DRAFT_297318 [Martensiomyces pterosporus]